MHDGGTSADVGLYVYGVLAAADVPTQDLVGLDGAQVGFVRHESLCAAVSPVSFERPPGRRKDLTAHSAVISGLAETTTVIPVRFGMVLNDDASVLNDLLVAREQELTALLGNLQGTVQMNLRASYVEERVLAEVVSADPRIADLRRRTRNSPSGARDADLLQLGELVAKAVEAKRADDTDALLVEVLPRVMTVRERPGAGVDHLVDIALLVPRDRLTELEGVLERIAEDVHDRIRLRLTGPFAAYDFIEEEQWV
jgi:hypothetical protein